MAKLLPDHLRVPWSAMDAVAVFVLAWIGLPVAVILAASALAPHLAWAHQFLMGIRAGDITTSFLLVLTDAIGGLGVVWLYLRRYHVGFAAVGWRPFNIWRAAVMVVGFFVVFVALATAALFVVSWLWPGFNANQAQSNEFLGSQAKSYHNLALIALVVLPPIIEETVFRGFLFPAFSKRFGAVTGAVLTSILFGVAHLQANISIYTFILSMMLCYMYFRLRSIFPGMALHMLNNYIAFVALSGK